MDTLITFIGLGLPQFVKERVNKNSIAIYQRHIELCKMVVIIFLDFLQTYNTDYQTPDSAGTATAFLCGKLNIATY